MKTIEKPLIIANWKMNLEEASAIDLGKRISNAQDLSTDVVICPSDILIKSLKDLASPNFAIGAQNCCSHKDDFGAYTGDISALMLKSMGCEYVIIAHSERRKYHHENHESISAKIANAHRAGLTPIICVGETLSQREQNQSEDVITEQLSVITDSKNSIIAYEPIWAIGTGKTPSLTEINQMHQHIRNILAEKFENKFKLVYGGSVKQDNAKLILAQSEVDGLLVGAASLDFNQFYQIIK